MPKLVKNLRPSAPVPTDAKGQWLVLIGDSGETSADDIEAFFADIWPDIEPDASIHERTGSPGNNTPSVGPHRCAHHQMYPDGYPPAGRQIH